MLAWWLMLDKNSIFLVISWRSSAPNPPITKDTYIEVINTKIYEHRRMRIWKKNQSDWLHQTLQHAVTCVLIMDSYSNFWFFYQYATLKRRSFCSPPVELYVLLPYLHLAHALTSVANNCSIVDFQDLTYFQNMQCMGDRKTNKSCYNTLWHQWRLDMH